MRHIDQSNDEERPVRRHHSSSELELSRIRAPFESREWDEWVSNKTGKPMEPPDSAKPPVATRKKR